MTLRRKNSKLATSRLSPLAHLRCPTGALLALLILGACGSSIDPDAAAEARLQSLSIVERAALLVAVPVRLDEGGAEVDSIVGVASAPDTGARPGALWIEAASTANLEALRARLPSVWAPILAASSDEGLGTTVSGLPSFPPISDLVRAGWNVRSLREVGSVIGRDAVSAGITLPIVSGPPISMGVDRLAIVRDSSAIAAGYGAIVEGAMTAGAQVGLHLYWSPDSLLTETAWDVNRFAALEGAALDGSMNSEVTALLTGGVRLASLDPEGIPAMLSTTIIRGRLRRDAAFDGLVIASLLGVHDEEDAMADLLTAVGAGADLVIARVEPAAAAAALVQAVTDGTIPQSRIDDAARKIILHMLRRDGSGSPVADPAVDGSSGIPPDETNRLQESAQRFIAQFQPPPAGGADSLRSAAAAMHISRIDPLSAGISAERLGQVTTLMRAALRDSVITAGAVLVLREGRVAFAEGFGVTGDDSPVDVNSTLFDLASLTKVVATTTAVSILVDRGDLHLDDAVRDHLPEFRGEGKPDVTIRHLLSHTAGLPSGLWLYGSASSAEEALDAVLEHRLIRPAGTDALYSDLGFILLAEIVERVTRRSIDRFLTEELFIPLGMSNTMYLPPWTARGRIVPTAGNNERPYPLVGVVHDANAFRLDGVAGHAGLFSTAADLAVFSEMMLRSGEVDGVRILSDSIVDIFRAGQPGAGERALGWDTPADVSSAGRFASSRAFGHTGYTGTSLWIDPEYDLTLILLTNRTYPRATSRQILDLRTRVHENVYQSITDRAVPRRPGAR